VPYSLRNNRFLLPEDLLSKYSLTVRNIWDRVYGKPSEELFDVALEVASYAKRAFEEAVRIYRAHPESFPEHSFRALLRGVETEYYLENLEKYNFNLFDQDLNSFSPVKLPYRVYNAAKARQFSVTDPKAEPKQ
jgi:NADH dehydrogenase [ubiquinone] 1 alpha subcomplex assembly factor 6